jgi:hypothetical protein
MSYIIYTSSGTVLTTVPTGKINTASTSLTLIGQDVANYGRHLNQNLVYMLGNFANIDTDSPKNPIQGQLWYDNTHKKLKIYDGNYTIVGITPIAETAPVGQLPGEFWYDSTQSVLKFLNDNGQYVELITNETNITKDELKAIVAASTDFEDFQTRIAAL